MGERGGGGCIGSNLIRREKALLAKLLWTFSLESNGRDSKQVAKGTFKTLGRSFPMILIHFLDSLPLKWDGEDIRF